MQEPAPIGIVEKNIAANLDQAGIQSTPRDVSTDQSHVLRDIEKVGGQVLHDAKALVDTTLGEFGGGETYIRTAKPENITDIIKEAEKREGKIASILTKLGLKKAA